MRIPLIVTKIEPMSYRKTTGLPWGSARREIAGLVKNLFPVIRKIGLTGFRLVEEISSNEA